MEKTEKREGNEIVILELDRPRELKLTNRTLKRFLAAKNIKLADLDEAIEDYDGMTYLVYEMLRTEDPSLTEETVDELLDLVPIGTIIESCSKAVAASFAVSDELAALAQKNPTMSRRNSAG